MRMGKGRLWLSVPAQPLKSWHGQPVPTGKVQAEEGAGLRFQASAVWLYGGFQEPKNINLRRQKGEEERWKGVGRKDKLTLFCDYK